MIWRRFFLIFRHLCHDIQNRLIWRYYREFYVQIFYFNTKNWPIELSNYHDLTSSFMTWYSKKLIWRYYRGFEVLILHFKIKNWPIDLKLLLFEVIIYELPQNTLFSINAQNSTSNFCDLMSTIDDWTLKIYDDVNISLLDLKISQFNVKMSLSDVKISRFDIIIS